MRQTVRVSKYRDEIYSLQILLSRTQAGPRRTVKQEQEEISPNHVQRLNLISVYLQYYHIHNDGLTLSYLNVQFLIKEQDHQI